MKKFNQVSQKLSAAVAASVFAASAFMLSACGGGNDESIKQAILRDYPNAKVFTFSEAQKEFGAKDKECYVEKQGNMTNTWNFVKTAEGEVLVLKVGTRSDNGASGVRGNPTTLEKFKENNSECFK